MSPPAFFWTRHSPRRSVGVQVDDKEIQRILGSIPSFKGEPQVNFRETLVTFAPLTRIPGKPVPGLIRSRPLLGSYIQAVENGVATRPGSPSSSADEPLDKRQASANTKEGADKSLADTNASTGGDPNNKPPERASEGPSAFLTNIFAELLV
jgi:hypothetical protein